jgi:alkylhydroperoxidase family enzyme
MPNRPVRLAPLTPEELTPEAQEMFKGVYGPDWQAKGGATFNMPMTFARHPDHTLAIFNFSRTVQSHLDITPRIREIVVMRVAWLHQADYEWGQHNQIMRQAGIDMGDAHLKAFKVGSEDPIWADDERAALRAVEDLFRTREVSGETWKALMHHYTPKQIIDILLINGMYTMLALTFNCVGLQLEPRFKQFAIENS